MINHKLKNLLSQLSIIVLLLIIPAARVESSGKGSVLEIIDSISPCLVYIQAENAVFAGSQTKAVKDTNSGRIFIARRIKSAKFDRKGAGVIISPSGIIVTNAHVVRRAGRITITLKDSRKIKAHLLSTVPGKDIAFIKIPSLKKMPYINFSDSDKVKLRDTVYTVGSSEFLRGTVSEGHITGIGKKNSKNLKEREKVELIQTDFNIYKGDSGGPLIDRKGRLLGLLTASIKCKNHTSFAIPSNRIRKESARYLK